MGAAHRAQERCVCVYMYVVQKHPQQQADAGQRCGDVHERSHCLDYCLAQQRERVQRALLPSGFRAALTHRVRCARDGRGL